jgi:hypothetical protein
MSVKNSVRRGLEQGAQRLSMNQHASHANHLSVAVFTIKHDLHGQHGKLRMVLSLNYRGCRLLDLIYGAE